MSPDDPPDQPPADDEPPRDPSEDPTHPPPEGPDTVGPSGPESVDPLSGIFGLDPVAPDRDPLIGMVIGGVRLVRVIGQGGMGKVYEGEQQKPRLTAAVKVMRPGLATPTRRARGSPTSSKSGLAASLPRRRRNSKPRRPRCP